MIGLAQAHTHNRQNELTQVGTASLTFDNNGNLTTQQNGKTLRWDAWNRLVEQKNGATSEIVYAYDVTGRRVEEASTNVYAFQHGFAGGKQDAVTRRFLFRTRQ